MTRLWGLVLLVIGLAGLMGGVPVRAAYADATQPVDPLAQVVALQGGLLVDLAHPDVAQDIRVPLRQFRPQRVFREYRLTMPFEVTTGLERPLWAVYLTSFYHGGTVAVNGAVIGEASTSTRTMTRWHVRPYLLSFPATLLRPGRNELVIEWSENQSMRLVSSLYVGPAEALASPYERYLFWQNTMAQAAFVHAIVIGVILLGIYGLRRHQQSYLLLGLGAFGFSLIVFFYFLPPIPVWLYPYWRVLQIAGVALYTSCAWLFLLRETDPHNRWFRALCIGWGALGPGIHLVNYWVNDATYIDGFMPAWGIVSCAIGIYPVALLVRDLWRGWAWRKFIFVLATGVAIVMGISDFMLRGTGTGMFGNVGYSQQSVSPLWFTALTAVLISDFVASLVEQAQHRRLLSERLAEQELELTALHARNRERDRERAAFEERQRIMQDMHDGLGSQLLSSLALSERGALSQAKTSEVLRECIDDLRLAIDTLSGDEDQFQLAVANLRFRMEPRLRAAGIVLAWDARSLSDDVRISASDSLPLLRILQEALTNALKHAGASVIRVELSTSGAQLSILVQDNGVGFDEATVRRGKGLSGMDKRARKMGATLSLVRNAGTLVRVILPLDRTGPHLQTAADLGTDQPPGH